MPDAPLVEVVLEDGTKAKAKLPDGLVTQDQVAESFVPLAKHDGIVARLKRQLEQAPTKDALAADEEFLGHLAETKGEFFTSRLNIPRKADAAELERLKTGWAEREVKPLQDKLKGLEGDVQRLLGEKLDNAVMAAALEFGVHEANIEPLKAWYRSRVKYDPEHRAWFVVGPDGEFEMTESPKKGLPPYKTVGEHLAELRTSGKYGAWFRSDVRAGAGFQGTGGPQTTKDLDQQIAEAEAAGKWALAGSLKAQKLVALRAKS